MKKIIDFLKNNSWIWIIVVVAIAFFGDIFLQNQGKNVTSSPTPIPKVASYNSITPGVSTENDLTKALGAPLTRLTNGNETTLEYRSTSPRRHVIILDNGKVVLIREMVTSNDTKNADVIISQFGTAPYMLYSNLANSTFNLYVYPSNGIAYLGHKDGTLLEVWYFEPTTISNFIASWGQDYSLTPPSNNTY